MAVLLPGTIVWIPLRYKVVELHYVYVQYKMQVVQYSMTYRITSAILLYGIEKYDRLASPVGCTGTVLTSCVPACKTSAAGLKLHLDVRSVLESGLSQILRREALMTEHGVVQVLVSL